MRMPVADRELADLIETIAVSFRVLRVRDGLNVDESLVYERARSLALSLRAQAEMRMSDAA